VEKSGPKIWGSTEIFTKLPKENNRPTGGNLSNLVTLKKRNTEHERRERKKSFFSLRLFMIRHFLP
jgi:hypothetical protein